MTFKIIQLTVPDEKLLPNMEIFSPDENYLMLKIGSDCLMEARKVVTSLTNDEIYRKLENEFKKEIEGLNNDIKFENATSLKMQEKITKMYETQIEQLNKKLDSAFLKITTYEKDNSVSLNEAIEKVKDKYDLIYKEKEKQVERMTDVYEKILVQQNSKSNSHKGSEGEKQFEDYATTFMDFKGFNIIDKHTQGGQGDFHLHFDDFDVLVDAKNYKKKIPVEQRDKIKKDLQKNKHLHFGWLVSLNTSIDKYDKSPIMYEWINTKQCLVYINNLSEFDDPKKILRIVWFTCKELYKLIEDVDQDENEITELRERNFKLIDKVKNIRKTIREINTSMNATRNLIQVMDDDLRGMLENETHEIVTSNISIFDDWWDQTIELTNDETSVSSTDLWTRFKQENKLIINEMNISGEKFKQYIKSKVPSSCIILRNKNANSAFDIKGIQLKEVKIKVIEEKIDVELSEEALKKRKVIKKKNEMYFDDNLDNKIINDYNSNIDIMMLSDSYEIKPWQVVSLLMKHKIIKKRDEALGYDKYKETEEYKQKAEKK